MRTHILAFDRIVTVESLDDTNVTRAARYTTIAAAVPTATGSHISSPDTWVGGVFARACSSSFDTLKKDLGHWAWANTDRYRLITPVCDLLLLTTVIDAGQTARTVATPSDVRRAATSLFGHDLRCHEACPICTAAEDGDWTRAIRLSAGMEAESAVAALVDAYRVARRGGLVTAVVPVADVDAGYEPGAPDPPR